MAEYGLNRTVESRRNPRFMSDLVRMGPGVYITDALPKVHYGPFRPR